MYLLGIMQIMHYLNGHNYSYHLQSTPLTLTVDAFIAKTHDPSIFCGFPFRCCFYFLSYFSAHPVKVLDFQLRASAKLFIFIYFQNDDVDITPFPVTLIPEYAFQLLLTDEAYICLCLCVVVVSNYFYIQRLHKASLKILPFLFLQKNPPHIM